ncbi:MAG: T9SS type A sorting domain-containing protein, partial [Bacteroidota bacterium]|nr:T9SS type A sorting domain-containing protein [Bacteroidota bacterium]
VVAHTLRAYLGDALFFSGLSSVLNNNQFTHINSYDFRNALSASTGLDLTDFFNDWVFNPGFPHFSIDSVRSAPSGLNYEINVYVKQKLKGAPAFYTNVPMQISFMDDAWNSIDQNIVLSGQYSSFNFTLPFNPVFTTLNGDSKINQAVSDEQKVIKTTGSHNFALARMLLNVSSVSDSALIKVEHNWAAPDDFWYLTPGLTISDYRYWKIDGILPENFKANSRIYYDGRLTTGGGGGYLDNSLLGAIEDSIILLYRKDPSENWREYEYYTQNQLGSSTPKYGYMTIDTLVFGEYTFAYGDKTTLNIVNNSTKENKIIIYPNPASSSFTVDFNNVSNTNYDVNIIDFSGKHVLKTNTSSNKIIIDSSKWNNGFYLVKIMDKTGDVAFKKLMLVK